MSSANLNILKCLCRLCAKQDKHCVNVFSSDGDKHLIQKKIRLCLPITIKENDVMPQQICLSCLNKLDTCYELYSGCVSAQSTIMKLIEASDVSITGISYPNPLLKVRKAAGLDSLPDTSASSPISLKDFLKQDDVQLADTCPHTKSANDAKNQTNDSAYPRIKVRKLDSDVVAGSDMISADKRTELASNNLDAQTASVSQVPARPPAMTANVSVIANTAPTDSSASQLHLLPKIANLQSLAKPSVSCVVSSSPAIVTSGSNGFEVATQPLGNIQPPQNVYLTSISNNMSNPHTQIMSSPISSTYIAPQTLVPTPLIASTYITAPSDNTHHTQAITPNYLIQPINSETTSAALVYVNTLNAGSSFLPHSTSQQISFAGSSAAPDNGNVLLARNLPEKQTSVQESSASAHFSKVATSATADKILTSAASNIFVSESPVINRVESLHLKTYENIKKNKILPRPQIDSFLPNTADNSPELSNSNGRLPEGKTLTTGRKHTGNQNFLLIPSNSEPCQQNIKIANKKLHKRLSAPLVNAQVPSATSVKNNDLSQKNSNNWGARTATSSSPAGAPHRGSNNAAHAGPVFTEPNKRSVAHKSSDGKQSPNTISSSSTSLDNNSKNSQGNAYPPAAAVKRGYIHISRTGQHSAEPSTLAKISALTPRKVHKTYEHSASNTVSQAPTSAAAGSASTRVHAAPAETHGPATKVKQESKSPSTSTSTQEDAASSGSCSSNATESPGSESKKTNAPSSSDENLCPYCHKTFDPEILIHHKTLHFRQKFFTCIDCGKNFKTEVGLQTHRCLAD